MRPAFQKAILGVVVLAASGLLAAAPVRAEEHPGGDYRGGMVRGGAVHGGPVRDGRGYVLDGRYNHGGYYPQYGAGFRSLPDGYRPYYHHGSPFYFYGGVWYAPGGPGFIVVQPPFGLAISVLPPFYSTLWFGGVPYYYADNVYYTASPDGYVVVEPPPNADQPGEAPPPPAMGQSDLIVYPKSGQTKEQQAADDYECHRWAKGQSGFDPAMSVGGGVGNARNNYLRAKSACLQARGYEVK